MEPAFDTFFVGGTNKRGRSPISIFYAPNTEVVKCQLHMKIACCFHNLPPQFHLDFQVKKLCTPPRGSTFSRLEMDILNYGRCGDDQPSRDDKLGALLVMVKSMQEKMDGFTDDFKRFNELSLKHYTAASKGHTRY
jgi:hypothetical protein